jgi:hypothetical protein
VGGDVTLSDVQNGLRTAILVVKKANGYSYDLPDDHVYSVSNQNKLNSKDAADYPKIIFTLDSGQAKKQASRNFDRSIRYGVTIIIREVFADDINNPPMGWRPVSDELRDLVRDVEKAILNNSTLGNLVDDVVPVEFLTDSDQAYPEAILVYYFDIRYRNQL